VLLLPFGLTRHSSAPIFPKLFQEAVSKSLTHSVSYLRRCGNFRLCNWTIPRNIETHHYITRMGFYRHLNIDVAYPHNEHDPTGRFFEVEEVKSEAEVLGTSVKWGDIVQAAFWDMSSGSRQSLIVAVSEVLENVFLHANSPVNAIVCAQTYPNVREIELAIVDCGCGFLESITNSPIHRPHCNTSNRAIRLATQLMVSGTGDPSRGYGLYLATELVRRNQGCMFIGSYDGIFKVNYGSEIPEHLCYTGGKMWPGSIVSLLLRIDGPLDIKGIYDDMPALEDEDLILPF
jgi:hypothetical protein